MKIVLVILAVAVAAQAAPYNFIGGGYPYTNALGFSNYAHGALRSPLTYSHLPAISPLTYSNIGTPITYSALPTVVQRQAVHPGYVAQTPGATHIAPLPAGLGYASHHINLAAAPGTLRRP